MSRSTTIEQFELERLYVQEKFSLDEIGRLHGCARPRIKSLLKKYKIPVKQQGGGNNTRRWVDRGGKPLFDASVVRSLFEMGYSWEYIGFLTGCNRNKLTSLKKYGKKYLNLKRWYQQDAKTFEGYSIQARRLTEKTYRRHKKEINPNNLPRRHTGINGAYNLDHIIPVRVCFDRGISTEECASLNNLRMLTWQNNLARNGRKYYL